MPRPDRILILTGAGLSAESGLSTFRDPTGIWAKYDWREVATPEGFARNPSLVYEFYNMRRRAHLGVSPNAAHFALAKLEHAHPNATIVTQNVDRLHEMAGSKNLIHMHGEVMKALCSACGWRGHWDGDMTAENACPACGTKARLRPDVVWFGETPYHMERIGQHLLEATLFISIGTSGNVYPAAGFAAITRKNGARTVELNLEASEGARHFDEAQLGPATKVVPEFVESLLAAV